MIIRAEVRSGRLLLLVCAFTKEERFGLRAGVIVLMGAALFWEDAGVKEAVRTVITFYYHCYV